MHISRSLRHLLALAAFLLSFGAQADPSYTVTVVGEAGSEARGLNSSGEVVGYLTTPGGDQHAFLYTGGITTDLGTLGGLNSIAWGINDAGQVVGGAENAGGVERPFSHAGGVMSDLGTLGGSGGYARAINNGGSIVGSARLPNEDWRGFLYSGGAMQNLGTLPSSGEFYSYAHAINEHGKIAGSSSAGEFGLPEAPLHAFVRCCSGNLVDLGTFGGVYSEAFGINDLGDVVGGSSTAVLMINHAFLYSGGEVTDLGTLPGDGYAYANDINNLRQVVGNSFGSGRGFLWEDGSMVQIDTLLDPADGWTVTDAYAINDAEQIAGTACMAGVCYAVRLDPVMAVPEPATYALFVAGLGLLGARARRRARRG